MTSKNGYLHQSHIFSVIFMPICYHNIALRKCRKITLPGKRENLLDGFAYLARLLLPVWE